MVPRECAWDGLLRRFQTRGGPRVVKRKCGGSESHSASLRRAALIPAARGAGKATSVGSGALPKSAIEAQIGQSLSAGVAGSDGSNGPPRSNEAWP